MSQQTRTGREQQPLPPIGEPLFRFRQRQSRRAAFEDGPAEPGEGILRDGDGRQPRDPQQSVLHAVAVHPVYEAGAGRERADGLCREIEHVLFRMNAVRAHRHDRHQGLAPAGRGALPAPHALTRRQTGRFLDRVRGALAAAPVLALGDRGAIGGAVGDAFAFTVSDRVGGAFALAHGHAIRHPRRVAALAAVGFRFAFPIRPILRRAGATSAAAIVAGRHIAAGRFAPACGTPIGALAAAPGVNVDIEALREV